MFNIFSTLKQGASNAANAVGNVAGTINTNLQNFGGDVYDAYSGTKNYLGNEANQIKNKAIDVGTTIGRNVSNAANDTYNFGSNVASAVSKVPGQVYQGATDAKNSYDSFLQQQGQKTGNAVREFGKDFSQGAKDLNYRAWDSVMKNTPTWEQTKAEFNKNTGGYDKAKVENIFSDMASKGYTAQQAMEVVAEIDKKDPSFLQSKSYGDKIRQSIATRGDEFGKTYNDFSSGKIGFGEAAFRNAGDILGTVGGVIGNTITQIPGVEPALKKVGEVATSIPGVKQGIEAYGEFAQANPRAAENLQALGNIGMTALGSTEGQKLISKGASTVGKGVKKVAQPIIKTASPYVDKIVEATPNIVGKTGEVISKPFKGIYNQAKIYISTPDEVTATQSAIRPRSVKGRTQANITDDIKVTNSLIKGSGEIPKTLDAYVGAIKNQMENIGKEINKLTGQDLGVDVTRSAQKLRSIANDTSSQLLDSGDAQKLLKLADDLESKGTISVYEAEQMNQVINSMLKSQMPNAGEVYKRGLNVFVQDLRQGLDDSISSIPGEFKDIKKAYGALRNVYGDAIARQIVVNRANPSGIYQSFSAIEGAGDIMSGLLKTATLDFKGGVSDIGKGLTKNAVGNFIIKKNSPDNLINEAFKSVKGSKIPNVKTKIKPEVKMLMAPKKGARSSEVFSPIKGSKSASELSKESMKELKPSIIKKSPK